MSYKNDDIPTVKVVGDTLEERGDLDGCVVAYFHDGRIEVQANTKDARYLRGLIEVIDIRAGALESLDEARKIVSTSDETLWQGDAQSVRVESRGARFEIAARLALHAVLMALFGTTIIANTNDKVTLHTDE